MRKKKTETARKKRSIVSELENHYREKAVLYQKRVVPKSFFRPNLLSKICRGESAWYLNLVAEPRKSKTKIKARSPQVRVGLGGLGPDPTLFCKSPGKDLWRNAKRTEGGDKTSGTRLPGQDLLEGGGCRSSPLPPAEMLNATLWKGAFFYLKISRGSIASKTLAIKYNVFFSKMSGVKKKIYSLFIKLAWCFSFLSSSRFIRHHEQQKKQNKNNKERGPFTGPAF